MPSQNRHQMCKSSLESLVGQGNPVRLIDEILNYPNLHPVKPEFVVYKIKMERFPDILLPKPSAQNIGSTTKTNLNHFQ